LIMKDADRRLHYRWRLISKHSAPPSNCTRHFWQSLPVHLLPSFSTRYIQDSSLGFVLSNQRAGPRASRFTSSQLSNVSSHGKRQWACLLTMTSGGDLHYYTMRTKDSVVPIHTFNFFEITMRKDILW
jgi:hypothetical protein